MGNYTEAAKLEHYENPTVMAFRDLDKFIEAYKARAGRPYTEWEQLMVSHQADHVINNKNNDLQDSALYYSVFSDLKQWANEKIDELQIFKLYPPLGQKFVEQSGAQTTVQAAESGTVDNLYFDKLKTGKTGVAFGLLRSRIGGRDVKIVTASKEADFPYYLGEIDFDEHFRVSIGKEVPYKVWRRFTFADEPEFELYYTKGARKQIERGRGQQSASVARRRRVGGR